MRYLLGLCAVLTAFGQPGAEDAFQATPQALRQAALKVDASPEDEVIVLLDDHRYAFDSAGRRTESHRQIIYLRKESAVEDWSTVAVRWNPWHEARPRIEARVIAAGGEVSRFDPQTIAEAPVQQFDRTIFSDQRMLRAPLPAVSAGAIIEWQTTTKETEPRFAAGVVYTVPVGGPVTVQRTRITVEAEVPLRHTAKLLEPVVTREGRRTQLAVELGPQAKLTADEVWAPADQRQQPKFSFSTGTSWAAIAARYEEIVEQQIRGASLTEFVAGITGTREAKIAAVLQRVRDQVRYTGVEFGEAAIVPRPPAEVLTRKFGDCKDKAALLVAALRTLEIPAAVALLSVNGSDSDPNLPGFDFDHAIVHIPGDAPLWIDVTDDTSRLGDLPTGDQGRWALIAGSQTEGLQRIPASDAERNRLLVERQIRMRPSGGADITQTVQAFGYFETELRQRFRGKQGDDLKKAMLPEIGRPTAEVQRGEVTPDGDYRGPYRTRMEATGYQPATVMFNEGAVAVAPHELLAEIPYALLSDPAQEAKLRTADLELPLSHRIEIRTEVTPPAGFRARPLPAAIQFTAGSVEYSATYATLPNGHLQIVQKLSAPRRRLTASEAIAAQKALYALRQRAPTLIQVLHTAQEQMAAGQWKEALDGLRQAAAAEPAVAAHQMRLAQAYLTAGAGALAREAAQRATELEPKSVEGQITLGLVYEHDLIGRHRRAGWNAAEAEAAYRRAVALEPKNDAAHLSLASLLEHDARGERYGAGARLTEAVAEYELVTGPLQGSAKVQRALALYHAGRLPDFAQAAQTPGMPMALTLVATAAQETSAAAIVQVQHLASSPQERAQLLFGTAVQLLTTERYAAAADLAKAAARLLPGAEREISFFTDLAGTSKVSDSGPEQAALRFRRLLADQDEAKLAPLLSKHFPIAAARQALAASRRALQRAENSLISLVTQTGGGQALLADLLLGPATAGKEGDDEVGYRLGGGSDATFVIREDGAYKVLGTGRDLSGVGRAVLQLAGTNLKAAKQWLDWVAALPVREHEANALPPYRVLWGEAEPVRTAANARATAASLILRDAPTDNEALAVLEAARTAEKLPALRSPYEQALAEARLRRGDFAAVLPLATALESRFPTAAQGYQLKLDALVALRNWPQLEAAIQAHQARVGTQSAGRVRIVQAAPDRVSNLARAQAAALQRQWAKAQELVSGACAEEYPATGDVEACAWLAVATGKADPKFRETLRKNDLRGNLAFTSAAFMSALGDLPEAVNLLQRSVAARGLAEPDAVTWLLQARILAGLGLPMAKDLPKLPTGPFDWDTVVLSPAARP